jgi:spore maturation protein SpmA
MLSTLNYGVNGQQKSEPASLLSTPPITFLHILTVFFHQCSKRTAYTLWLHNRALPADTYMALNYIWSGFFLVGFAAALLQWLFLGDTEIFKKIIDGTFESARAAVMDIALPLAGIMTLWLGIMNIGEKAGAVGWLARVISPFFSRIFPDVPKDHPATGHMVMNFSANLLGLDNAATPFGLKAMESLQTLNPNKDTASNAQIMFLVLHTSGLTLIPLAIMAQRAILGAANPADIFIPCIIATYVATVTGIIVVSIRQGINLVNRVVLGWLGGITAAIVGLVCYFMLFLTKPEIELVSKVASNLILFSIIIIFIAGAMRKGVNVYEAFIEGAKGGITTSLTVIPYLVGMLVAISVIRNSGVLGFIVAGLDWIFVNLGMNTDFTPALPTALMKPLSGSGSKAMMIDAMQTYGVDSFVGRLACIFQGSADTTFYIVALYFGSVGIRKTRYAISCGLLADFAGIVTAILVAYMFFG